MSKVSNRNEYIDFLRGIATVNIILIHTACYFGIYYLPQWFIQCLLLVDVPFFFYLSGWASQNRKPNPIKTSKSLLKIFVKWAVFVCALVVGCQLTKLTSYPIYTTNTISGLINTIMFSYQFKSFHVLKDSLWFMKCYFQVLFINSFVLFGISKCSEEDNFVRQYLVLLVGLFFWHYFGNDILGEMKLDYFLFYSAFWMMGYSNFGKTNNLKQLLVVIAVITICVVICSYQQCLSIMTLQMAKFPPSPKYGFASLYIIFIARFFEPKAKNEKSLVSHIGKNAIYYYFAQGIACSLPISNVITINQWVLKFVVVSIINIIITVVIAEAFAFAFSILERMIKKTGIKEIIKI